METLKVSSKSNPSSVAGALANVFREKDSVEVQAVGAGALNQAIKAIAIARGFVAPTGKSRLHSSIYRYNHRRRRTNCYKTNRRGKITSFFHIIAHSQI